MKYWKGNTGTNKEGQCGTHADDDFVPDSTEITGTEYEAWIASLPVPPVVVTQLETDIAGLSFSSLGDVKTKIQPILERLRKGER
jgi:hypothetical protein